MILNFEVYGAKAEYISDIMTQINSIMTAAAMKAEHNIEQKAEMTSFAFFAVIIFLVVYMVGTTMSGLNIF
jgi:heme/copper-type cytochrome/quinol oxidase subunit 1